jgi:hypothetical protein
MAREEAAAAISRRVAAMSSEELKERAMGHSFGQILKHSLKRCANLF